MKLVGESGGEKQERDWKGANKGGGFDRNTLYMRMKLPDNGK